MGRSVNDRVDAGDRLAHPVAGRQVARDPLNPWVDAGSAGENAYLVALLAQTRHDHASEVSGPPVTRILIWRSCSSLVIAMTKTRQRSEL
jgi:hypothetical protein